MSSKTPLVSVCMITYNHEKFIAEAIEGVLIQEVDFEVELIIADDCSTDRTGEIVKTFIDSHPKGHWIKYTRHEKNLGMMPNFIWSIEAAKGSFVALCEGDDYWIEQKKLTQQIKFLEENPDFSLVGHKAKKIYSNGLDQKIIGEYERSVFKGSDKDFLFLSIPTATIVFRNQITFPDWVYKVYGGDTALIYLALQEGFIKTLDLLGSVYRVHSGGIEQNFKKDKISLPLRNINQYSVYYDLVDNERRIKIAKRLSWNHFYLAIQFFLRFDLKKSFFHSKWSIYWKIKSFEICN